MLPWTMLIFVADVFFLPFLIIGLFFKCYASHNLTHSFTPFADMLIISCLYVLSIYYYWPFTSNVMLHMMLLYIALLRFLHTPFHPFYISFWQYGSFPTKRWDQR